MTRTLHRARRPRLADTAAVVASLLLLFILADVVLQSQHKQTLPVWLAGFSSGFKQTDWGGLMAASTLFAVPVIVFFLVVQRRIQAGTLTGVVKA